MLRMVTGTGCMTTALVGTFLGGEASPLACAVAAVATMGIAGEISKAKLSGNEGSGTFRVGIIDAIYNMKEEDFVQLGSGDTDITIAKYEGDEEYRIIVSRNYYETFIPLGK